MVQTISPSRTWWVQMLTVAQGPDPERRQIVAITCRRLIRPHEFGRIPEKEIASKFEGPRVRSTISKIPVSDLAHGTRSLGAQLTTRSPTDAGGYQGPVGPGEARCQGRYSAGLDAQGHVLSSVVISEGGKRTARHPLLIRSPS